MSLPSQIGRIGPAGSGGRARTYMVSKRKRARRRPIIALVLMGGMGAVIAYVWMQKTPAGGPVEAATVRTVEDEDTGEETFPFEFGAPSDPAPEPAKVELTMGQGVQSNVDEAPVETDQRPTARPAEPARGSETTEASRSALSVVDAAQRELSKNNTIGARALLETALRGRTTPEHERAEARRMITEINEDLIFSPRLHPEEPLTDAYKIKPGDSLSQIAKDLSLATDWRLIQRVNRISNPMRIRAGQTIKVVRGPFHAVVDKSDYRMDVYAGPPEQPREWRYIRSFDVGLGEDDSTPTGNFVIRQQSKLMNPVWDNPRTGERIGADDPENPIGERWLGLEGLGESASLEAYGIHGTIDPDSIGEQRSMGCVRLGTIDVEIVYELLTEGVSRVTIVD